MGEIKSVEQPVCEEAEKKGYHFRKVVYVGRRGAPDRLFFGQGEHFYVEFKDAGEEPEDHQWREIQRMRKNGIPVYVIDNVAAGKKLFATLVLNRLAHCIRLCPTPKKFKDTL